MLLLTQNTCLDDDEALKWSTKTVSIYGFQIYRNTNTLNVNDIDTPTSKYVNLLGKTTDDPL